ncbi:MAG: DUF3181 family protein [Kaiparowitsia implicata GSE-PSE-MK54-09C]|jgi:hypothetical protein|nr:DUF3181 family protein [Kaiparowitsia implicata GSE-PSE-MK54-09C]
MSYANSSEAVEALAAEIGKNVYLDIAKWHLYLRETALHTRLANTFYPMMANGTIAEADVAQALSGMTVDVGGGKRAIALTDFLPTASIQELLRTLEDFQHDL